jgi:threonine dehydrogenase-like Zn-dependent dehydrogenase
MATMKALVKRRAEPGLWLEDVPVPEMGINDVLIRVDRTGICGTDLHIYKWDAWAAKTIPVPMVVGHEFVGEIVAVGSNVNDFFRRPSPPLQRHQGNRSQSARGLRRVPGAADVQCLASPA